MVIDQSEPKLDLVNVFRNRTLPEPAQPAGYAALIDRFSLRVPLPLRLAAISGKSQQIETSDWLLLSPEHARPPTLIGQLEFAFKWEGVDLGVLNALFREVPGADIADIVQSAPTGSYARRIWFLYEWLTGEELDVPEPGKVRAVHVLDTKQQYGASDGELSSRHKVRDNLPGTPAFCPLVRRTAELTAFENQHLDAEALAVVGRTHPDIVRRAAGFLLLGDSRASFEIEGERPSTDRASRWAGAIDSAGSVELTTQELDRLQRILISDSRFVELGLRREGGFIGTHDRATREPIPEHISARAADLGDLLDGLVAYEQKALAGGIDAVVTAAAVSFGFVYMHPYVDGNGRIHRWLIHHTLAEAGYNPPGVVFPVSAAMLRLLPEYSIVLRSYSRPLLELIEWRPTVADNVEVLNETGDYYRYFDATSHAEFLYRCVQETVQHDLPDEVSYLEAYDRFSREVQTIVDLPERTVELLVRFLEQGDGELSKRAREKEFAKLAEDERAELEELFAACFGTRSRTAAASSGR